MKKMSIKLRVTLWYVIFMIMMVALVLVCILSISSNMLRSAGQTQLKSIVQEAFDEIEYEDGGLEIDDDLDYFQNGIYLSVYDQYGNLLYGKTPTGFSSDTPLTQDIIQTVGHAGDQWYVYDLKMPVENSEEVWVRGVVSTASLGNSIGTVINLALITLPFIVIVAAVGGYFITKRAFVPVSRITGAAERINGGKDLSQRINLQGGKDEIYDLAETFDRMFDRLQNSFEAEKQFTSDASHELRTPTAVITSHCEDALKNTENPEETEKALQIILQQARKMSGLIAQLLTLARTENARQKLDLELVNLSEIAEIVVEEQRLIAANKKIEIKTQIEPDLILRADQTMIIRLFINLIDNAITYSSEGGHIKVTLHKEGDTVTGTVQDNGIGIKPEHLHKIWNRFFQADPSRTGGKGSGLGLSMVKWIVEAHGGSISAESTVDEGSFFRFKI